MQPFSKCSHRRHFDSGCNSGYYKRGGIIVSKKGSATAAPKGVRTLNDRKKMYNTLEPYVWIAPSVILMAIFIIVPIF